MVSTLAATTAAVWVTPSIIGLDRAAAAQGSAPNAPAIAGNGTFATLTAGESLRPNSAQYSSNTQFFVFNESITTLTSPYVAGSGDTVPAGQPIFSYLIHFSPATTNSLVTGTVTFPGTIVGYDSREADLRGGDAQFGCPGVNYGTSRRQLEGSDTANFTLPSTVDLSLFANPAFNDQVRVFVI